jgi:lysophospholipase L1-like esterase
METYKLKLLAFFVSISMILVILIFIEIVYRISESPIPPSLLISSPNPKLVYELNPLHPGINRHGMRHPEFSNDELRGKYIIAAIGDSHTFSVSVKNITETYPSRLQFYLRKSFGLGSVCVLNFGVPGYNTSQELEVLKNILLKFKPNLVVLQYCINDTYVCNYIQPKHKTLNSMIHKSHFLAKRWQRLLYGKFGRKYLYGFVSQKFPDMLLYKEGLVGTVMEGEHPTKDMSRVPPKYHYMLGRENLEKHTLEFASICKKANIKMIATGFIEKEDRLFYERAGFDVYTFYDIYAGQNMEDYGYPPPQTVGHFNGEGNDIIGRSLAKHIYEKYLKPIPNS